MVDAAQPAPATRSKGWRSWWHRRIASPRFQDWAAGFPLTRGLARRDGAEIFDLVQGFVISQALMALVELWVLHRLMDGPQGAATLGPLCSVPVDRMEILLQAGAAMGLLQRRRDGRFGLARKGAALLGVPGLEPMIRHHKAFYRDLEDPVALLRGQGRGELAAFWPYVFGAGGATDPEVTATYSDLMAQSQHLVAQDTLRQVNLSGVTRLLDVGGGTGAFLSAVARAHPKLELHLFDLPLVRDGALARFDKEDLTGRVTVHGGSFRDDPLPAGADAISLIRVLYDHTDDTVRALLAKVFATLPPGGRLIVSEPMGGGHKPERAGDVYFAFYTMAMGTGRARSARRIAELAAEAGFVQAEILRPARPYVTSVVTAQKPGAST